MRLWEPIRDGMMQHSIRTLRGDQMIINRAIQSTMSHNKETAGRLPVDDPDSHSVDRPDPGVPMAPGDKSSELRPHGIDERTVVPSDNTVDVGTPLQGSSGTQDTTVPETLFVSNDTIVQIFRKKISNDDKEIEACLEKLPNFSLAEREKIVHRIKKLKGTYERKWKEAKRTMSKFESQNKDWLNLRFEYTPQHAIVKRPVGRPTVPFDQQAKRTKRQTIKDVYDEIMQKPLSVSLSAVAKLAIEKGEYDLAYIAAAACKSPGQPVKLATKIKEKSIIQYSPQEALALIIDNDFSVAQYKNLRIGAIAHNAPQLYPSYDNVLAIKHSCRPNAQLILNETCCEVPLQALLNHTAERLATLQMDYIKQYCESRNAEQLEHDQDQTMPSFTLVCSYGFDGSTGQSQYKQTFQDSDQDDSSLFATTLIPLQLRSDIGLPIWNNQTPQSYRFCRPLRLRFAKESADLVRNEHQQIKNDIDGLRPFSFVTDDGKEVSISFVLCLTVIDGKCLSIVTNTASSLTCPICKKTPKFMNQLADGNFTTIEDNLQYGISPLHAWIRFLEFCLHLGYRNVDGLRCWRVQGTEKQAILDARKRNIVSTIKQEMGLLIDMPKQGGAGTTNDGNTARRVFSDKWRKRFAEIIGIEEWLVNGLHTILVVISSGYHINSNKFDSFCKDLLQMYIAQYNWYYLPVTVHKILVHGREIIDKSVLPVGMLSEQAGESRNKYYRRYRLQHAVKTSRQNNLRDVFNRSLESSDPAISTLSLRRRTQVMRKQTIPAAARELLEVPEESVYVPSRIVDEPSDETEQEDAFFESLEAMTLDSEDVSQEISE